MTHRLVLLSAAVAGILVAPANANSIPFSFSTSGTLSSRDVAGNATFVIDTEAKTLTVTLTNTLSETIKGSSQALVGVTWSYGTSSPVGVVTGSTPWVVATGIVDCSSSTNKVSKCITGSGTSPYGWNLNTSTPPSGSSPSQPNLFAGNGGKPYGIMTNNIDGSSDGIRTSDHNPYLVGPVSFTLGYTAWTGTPTINGATLYFGTAADHLTGSPDLPPVIRRVPDGGATLMMLGGALVGLETLRRRFRA